MGNHVERPTKTCPFCQEEILAGALKCRHCQSLLVATPREESEDRRVTYIVDRDLLRFAKFAAAVVAVLSVVGLILFGFNLEETLERLKDAKQAMEVGRSELETARAETDRARGQLDRALQEAERLLGQIRADSRSAAEVLEGLRTLDDDGERRLQEARTTPGSKARKASDAEIRRLGADLWIPGSTLRIRFLDGRAEDHRQVEKWAVEWTQSANLSFDFGEAPDAELRISFDPSGGSWTYVGAQALAIPTDKPTMNLGWVRKTNVLHEFGHVLGLIHEHQIPAFDLAWNRDQVYADLAGPPNFWSRQQVETHIFEKSPYPTDKPFDVRSIMLYSYPPNWFVGEVPQIGGEGLSPLDRQWAATLYPK